MQLISHNHLRRATGCAYTSRPRRCSNGFSLIELSVVILLVTLLLGSILVPLQTQVEQRQYRETEKRLEQIKEALIGYAISNRYLPCPAVSATNGAEDRTGTACTGGKRIGFVPWVALGIQPSDPWDNFLRYSVDPEFTISDPLNRFTLDDVGDITVRTRNSSGAVNLATTVPVIVLSHGKNGFGATSVSNVARGLPATWNNTLDEFANANNSTSFWSRTISTNTGAAGGQFDDAVTWITPGILASKMVGAGRLP